MSYARVTAAGREYRAVQVMECQECLARLDDDEQIIELHEAFHALKAQAAP